MEVNGFNINPQSGEAGANEISISIAAVNEGIDKTVEINAVNGDKIAKLTLKHEGLREKYITADGEVYMTADNEIYGVLKGGTSINIENYLTIEALADGLTASLASDAVEYCVDGSGKWITLEAGVATEAINTGQTLSFRAYYTASNTSRRFSISKSCNVLGDPMSLYYGENAKDYSALPYSYSFSYLFYNCTTIVDATRLILDRTLKTYAYAYMFYGCSNLLYPPELPATTLSTSCYRYMFRNCSNLLRSPILPALKLPAYCYEYMFTACSDLAEITMLATDKSGSNCMLGWVSKVKSKGTFYKNKDATWTTTGVSGVPSGWTVVLI